jgi:hypothetical protein
MMASGKLLADTGFPQPKISEQAGRGLWVPSVQFRPLKPEARSGPSIGSPSDFTKRGYQKALKSDWIESPHFFRNGAPQILRPMTAYSLFC